jgi:hypothetical protein
VMSAKQDEKKATNYSSLGKNFSSTHSINI